MSNENTNKPLQDVKDDVLSSAGGGFYAPKVIDKHFGGPKGAVLEVFSKVFSTIKDWTDNTNQTKLEKADTINQVANDLDSTADVIHQARQKSA